MIVVRRSEDARRGIAGQRHAQVLIRIPERQEAGEPLAAGELEERLKEVGRVAKGEQARPQRRRGDAPGEQPEDEAQNEATRSITTNDEK